MRFIHYDNTDVVEGICVDRKCNTIDPNCIDCYIILATGVTQCKYCNEAEGWTLNPDNVTCSCMPGYVLINGACQQCGKGCLTCNTELVCNNCANGAVPISTETCGCVPGSYLTTQYGPIQCMPCEPNCAQCQIESNICLQCINGFETVNYKCVCPSNKFITQDGAFCNACSTGCIRCSGANTCLACAP